MANRMPPQNLEAEEAVLGAIMIKEEAFSTVSEILTPDDFYREANRLLYKTMQELFYEHEAIDIVTVIESLRKKKELEKVGGVTFVAAIANSVPTAANVSFHAKIVREKADLRRLIDAATIIASKAYNDEEDVADIMDDAEQKILAVARGHGGRDFTHVKTALLEAVDRISYNYDHKGGFTGLRTNFTQLDIITNGLQASDLILIAARPSMGKTAFVLNIAANVARADKVVAFFSLEMSKDQLVSRMIASEGSLDSQRLRTGDLQDGDWDNVVKTADTLSKMQLYIDDTPGISIMDLRGKARRLKAEAGLDLIIIDYLQLMQGRTASKGDNRQQEISEISRSLKALARELNVPVIALSQLSRGVESRTVKRPMLSDLRESGSLEQDADLVMFLYREDYYDEATERKNITDIIIAKHRNGPIGNVELYFRKEYTKFTNIQREG
ncbi:MAG: replicative DNA helicase [Selenomonadaceae bacterium]|nr:replicative DNA helicase [Selenomonadaceae bacterium]